ncbi:MAG: TetR/AcrR family transcriptional regulator [Pseudomonadota bacterium]
MRHGGRPQLIDQDQIVQAALAVGLDHFSINAVARHLGVSGAAIYRYVDTREALLALCLDAFVQRLEVPPRQEWRPYLAALAAAFRRALLATPGAAQHGFKLGPSSPKGAALLEEAIACLMGQGFPPKLAWQAVSAVIDHAVAWVQKEELAGEPDSARHKLAAMVSPERHPHLSEALATVLPPDLDQAFEARTTFLLRGVEATLKEPL